MPPELRDPITPQVPAPLLDAANDIEKHLLEQSDIARQQNDRIILAVEHINRSLDRGAGKIKSLEAQAADCEQDRRNTKAFRRSLLLVCTILGPLIYGIIQHLIERIFP